MKRKALGKGLGALIREVDREEESPSEIDLHLISRNPDQPRFKIEDEGVDELAASIRENGVLQPVLVRRLGNGYQLVAGERRLAAAQRAGLLKIPAVVRDVPDDRLLEFALVENIQREDLNPIEEAQAYQKRLDGAKITQEELAARLGKERSTVANSLRLLKLPPAVKLLVAEGKLTPGHARALLSSSATAADVTKTAETIVKQGWSVRETEKWARNLSKKARLKRMEDPNIAAAADRLRMHFGTKVEILANRGTAGGGRIQIHFYSAEDLERVFDLLMNPKP